MAGRLEGKTAFITGAAQGIGRETALAFALEGARVVASDINEKALSELTDESSVKVETVVMDATDEEAVNSIAHRWGAVDIVFNCAGYVHHGTIADCDKEDWMKSFETNVTSTYLVVRAFLPFMVEAGGGSIINMSSIVSSLKSAPSRFAYATMKAALIGLTKSIARDFIQDGVRCNSICPGTVQTPSWEERVAASADPTLARKDFIARQPMGRIGSTAEIAAAAVFLASEEAAYMTGSTLIIDGGMSL